MVEGVAVKRVPVLYRNSMTKRERIQAFIQFALRSTATAIRTPADVVFATSTPLSVAIPGLAASRFWGARFVFEVRDLWPEVPISLGFLTSKIAIRAARTLEAITYRRADHVIALSPAMAQGVNRVNPTVHTSVIPNAADLRFFNTASVHSKDPAACTQDKEKRIVFAGSFGETYCTEELIDIAYHLRAHGIRVKLYGDGARWNATAARCRRLGLDSSDVLPGAVPRSEVPRIYASSDAVLSSLLNVKPLHGNSLNKVFDAMAASRPVIFTHGGWLPQLMTEAGAGWQVDSSKPQKAAREIAEILSSPDFNQAGARSAALGRQFFDREILFHRFERVLRDSAATPIPWDISVSEDPPLST